MCCEVRCSVLVLVWFATVVVRWSRTCGTLWAGDSDASGTGTVPVPAGLGVDDSEWYNIVRCGEIHE